MLLQVVAVYDVKAHSFANPIFMAHEDLAIRSFREAARQKGNAINQYPEDHVLYHLGTFDDVEGEFVLKDKPVVLINGKSLRKEEQA